MDKELPFEGSQLVFVDSIGYIEDKVDLCFWIYEQGMLEGCRLVLGGCDRDSKVTDILMDSAFFSDFY